ncbi:MAG TPA: phosphoglucomutase/phosphomannomutase family protein [Thermoanaerobaculia bacterium]|nr:phosphoglucomutase/phosphomannomutase family protein [Thermoanaerobaculia bacterium]
MSFPLGTDGWRGVIAEGCTFQAIEELAAATASVYASLPAGDTSRTVVGHDTRFFSPEFARRASDALARGGIDVLLTRDPIPTPAVSYHVRRLGLAGGVAITASHNPGAYNGFKIKSHTGGSAPPELYSAVENAIGRPASPPKRGGAVTPTDLLGPYRDALAERVDLAAIRSAGLSVLADSMHGAAGTLVHDILAGGRTRVIPFRSERDPLFGGVHPEPIAANLAAAAARVVEENLDLAVAQDGDADRLGVLDRRGKFVSPHRILALLLLHAYRRRGLRGGIAKTFSTSLLIDRVADSIGVPLHETAIGFKYVADLMNRGEADAGGEESGGYAFSFHLPERDGALNALLLIESLALSGQDLDGALAALAGEFGEFAYDRRDVYLPVPVITSFLREVRESPPSAIAGQPVTDVRDKDGVKYVFDERGWLLHRLSGTEPMIRLYCEHEDESLVDPLLDAAESRLVDFAARSGAAPGAD